VAGSFPIFDGIVEHVVASIAPNLALDVGAGSGKYGRLLQRVAPSCDTTALELSPRHVKNFGLEDLYGRVEVGDAATWWRSNPDEIFDLVIAGDCLQSMAKSEGLDFLNAMVYRCAWLVVLAPEFIIQGAIDGELGAVHRSVWSERDLHWHDLWAWDNTRAISLFVLRGYQPSTLTIDALVRGVNDGALPVHDYDGQSLVRPCRLRLVDHAREAAYRPR
jgi:SAM-dependent methyltransferase